MCIVSRFFVAEIAKKRYTIPTYFPMFRRSQVHGIDQDRLRILAVVFLLLAGWIIARLFILQIIQHEYYALFALNTHEISEKLFPRRGEIYFKDSRTNATYPAAVNKDFYLVYAVPAEVVKAKQVEATVATVATVLGISDEEQKKNLLQKLSKSDDPYEPVAKKVPEDKVVELRQANLKGIYAIPQRYRFYPEESLASSVLGFVKTEEEGTMVGQYGLEGYWDKKIAGKGGFVSGERGALGGWITLADRTFVEPEDGMSLVLTIDRALEYKACETLRKGLIEYKAKSASLIMMDPNSGAILAMCSLPDFDPNNYSQVEDVSVFNNTTVFTPYEPGSVFKSVTMAAGLDLGLVTPETTYTDPCERTINGRLIRNADERCYGKQTMTNVLEKSINTGVVMVQEKMGNEQFKKYVERFGFGQKTGITLNTEVAGDISALGNKGQIFGATASYGQGILATPLQIAVAYSAIANDGNLPKPYIVEELRYANGKVEKINPETVEQVIASRSAKLLSGMLTSVVEHTYKAARIPGYYVAGKTGTAQIAEKGGYSATRTNHTFVGFAPADSPRFVLVVKYEEPERRWAESTTVPVFQEVMKFALDYYGVPMERQK